MIPAKDKPRSKRSQVLRLVMGCSLTAFGCTTADLGAQAEREEVVAPQRAGESPITVALGPGRAELSAFAPEQLALATMLVEIGLADLPGVTAELGEGLRSPGLDGAPQVAPRYRGELVVRQSEQEIAIDLTLCAPDGECVPVNGKGTTVTDAVAEMLGAAAKQLARSPLPEARAGWKVAPSKDPYATLIAGRAAGVLYGTIAPPVTGEGDRRRDPITRAVFLDPKNAMAWWVDGRRRLSRGDATGAEAAFRQAVLQRPATTLFRADQAAALLAAGQPGASGQAWVEVERLASADLRFLLSRVRAAWARGALDDANEGLSAMPESLRGGGWLELEAAVQEASGASASRLDALFARWQNIAPEALAPVRKRIALAVREGRHEDAYALAEQLEARGSADEARRLRLSLSVALGRLEQAEAEASALGLSDLAVRLRERARLALAPDAIPDTPKDASTIVRLARAEALLRRGRAADANREIEAVLVRDPWSPEGLALLARARASLGDRPGAAAARARLERVDPKLSSLLFPAH